MGDEIFRRYRGRFVWAGRRRGFQPAEPAEFAALERELGAAVPPAYRAFLTAVNGGHLEYHAIRVPPGRAGELVEYGDLYRLGRDPDGGYGWGTLLGEYRQQTRSHLADRLPLAGLLPVARTGGDDDRLFVDLRPEGYGRVLGYRCGLPAWTGLPTDDWFGELAPDFDAYLDALVVDRDEAADAWADAAELDPRDPVRLAVVQWLDQELPGWREAPWAGRA
jgi:hypothetical protein